MSISLPKVPVTSWTSTTKAADEPACQGANTAAKLTGTSDLTHGGLPQSHSPHAVRSSMQLIGIANAHKLHLRRERVVSDLKKAVLLQTSRRLFPFSLARSLPRKRKEMVLHPAIWKWRSPKLPIQRAAIPGRQRPKSDTKSLRQRIPRDVITGCSGVLKATARFQRRAQYIPYFLINVQHVCQSWVD